MGRRASSQWEFGDLFAPQNTRRVFSVSELTQEIRTLLERQIGQVWVSGEVSNLRVQSSGHIYFSLKDASAQIACVLFRGEDVPDRSLLQDGQKLTVQGDLTVYAPRGQYQIVVRAIELQGIGALQAAFERLKRKLEAEGLFAAERKRPLPRYPQRIGLVTSPSGAAIRDVLHVMRRRFCGFEIIFVPCRVQGEGAAEEVAQAVRMLNRWNETHVRQAIDVILVTRGGGSLEDLWAFNEEIVARAIFDSAIPVLSAVGHEIDFTICDFVADARAATPSAAAEILTEGYHSSRQLIEKTVRAMGRALATCVEHERHRLRDLAARLRRVHPRRAVEEKLQYLDDLQNDLARNVRRLCETRALAVRNLQHRLRQVRPAMVLRRHRERVDDVTRRLDQHVRHRIEARGQKLQQLISQLRLLGPQNVLARGYSITLDAVSGQVIRSARQVRPGQRLRTQLHEGQVQSTVDRCEAGAGTSDDAGERGEG